MSEQSITVAMLIERLLTFDQAAVVMIDCAESLYAGAIQSVEDVSEGRAVAVRGELTKAACDIGACNVIPAVFIKTPFS